MLQGGHSVYEESYRWSQFGNFGLRLDGLSLPFALIIYILCTVIALYSKPYMIHKILEDAHERFGGKKLVRRFNLMILPLVKLGERILASTTQARGRLKDALIYQVQT